MSGHYLSEYHPCSSRFFHHNQPPLALFSSWDRVQQMCVRFFLFFCACYLSVVWLAYWGRPFFYCCAWSGKANMNMMRMWECVTRLSLGRRLVNLLPVAQRTNDLTNEHDDSTAVMPQLVCFLLVRCAWVTFARALLLSCWWPKMSPTTITIVLQLPWDLHCLPRPRTVCVAIPRAEGARIAGNGVLTYCQMIWHVPSSLMRSLGLAYKCALIIPGRRHLPGWMKKMTRPSLVRRHVGEASNLGKRIYQNP